MSLTFRRHGQVIRADFHRAEVDLLRSLHDQLVTTLEEADPDDPVIRRLFPPAVLGDAKIDQEVRHLFVDDLLAARRVGLEALVELLDRGRTNRNGGTRLDLADDEPMLVLGVLNDVRLAIGARLDVEALDRELLEPDDPVAYRLAIMDHLGWWQEQLLAIIEP